MSNRREDRWGGSLENRTRLLLDIVSAIRAAAFSPQDAKAVVAMLPSLGVDFVELSGGSYEAPTTMGTARDERALARKVAFLEFAREIAKVATMPLMVTGGIRRREVAEQVVQTGVALAAIATALAIEPHLPSNWQAGKADAPVLGPIAWKSKPLASAAHMAAAHYQMGRLSQGSRTRPDVSPVWALLCAHLQAKRRARRYRHWIGKRKIAGTAPA